MQSYSLTLKKDEILCRTGDPSTDLYYLQSGKLLICIHSGTQVKALNRIDPGEFIGELSFFDGKVRTAHIIAMEDCQLIQIPKQEISGLLPPWFMYLGKNITKKIRLLDHIVSQGNLRKFKAEENKPLSIDEQRHFLKLINP